MGSRSYQYSNHAIQQMFKRGISTQAVEQAIEQGEVIKTYPDDRPFPSQLILGWIGKRPLHVVYSEDQGTTIVITAYEPSPSVWEEDFKTKKSDT